MRREAVTQKSKTDRMVNDIRRKTRKKYSSEDKPGSFWNAFHQNPSTG